MESWGLVLEGAFIFLVPHRHSKEENWFQSLLVWKVCVDGIDKWGGSCASKAVLWKDLSLDSQLPPLLAGFTSPSLSSSSIKWVHWCTTLRFLCVKWHGVHVSRVHLASGRCSDVEAKMLSCWLLSVYPSSPFLGPVTLSPSSISLFLSLLKPVLKKLKNGLKWIRNDFKLHNYFFGITLSLKCASSPGGS